MKQTRNVKPPAPWHTRVHRDYPALLPGVALIALTFVCYAPALKTAGFIWDDDAYVTRNEALRSLDGLRRIWVDPRATPQYYPVTFTTLWLEYQAWRSQPAAYHLTNVCLHAASVVLLWRLLVRLAVPGAWLAAALFAVHPVEVESVAWITERKNVLSLFLAFGSLLCYFRFEPPETAIGNVAAESATTGGARRWRYYAASLALFVAALGSKTVVASLPAVILVLLWWKRARIDLRTILPLIPFFLFGVVLGLQTVWLEKHHVGATGEEWLLTPLGRILLAGRAVAFYAGKLCWPHPLIFIYPKWSIDTHIVWQYLFPLGVGAVVAALWFARHKLGRGALAAVLIFIGVLVPALGFFDVYPFRYSYVADHFQYHASVALLTLGGAAVTIYMSRPGRQMQGWGVFAAAVVLGVCILISWQREEAYRDRITLFRDVLAQNPDCWMAHDNLGAALSHAGQPEEALKEYLELLRIKPDSADHEFSVARELVQLRRFDEARRHFEQGLSLDPRSARGHGDLGTLLVQMGRSEEAIEQFQQALEIDPHFAYAHSNLGLALTDLRRYDEAYPHMKAALELMPEDAGANGNLAMICKWRGDQDEAILYYRKALQIDPDNGEIRKGFGESLALAGRFAEAVDEYHLALARGFDMPSTHLNLGIALANCRQLQEAIGQFELALRGDPSLVAAYIGIVDSYAQLNRVAEAIAAAENGLKVARAKKHGEAIAILENRLEALRADTIKPRVDSP